MLKIEENKNLEKYNSYKIKVVAKYFVELDFENNYENLYKLFDFIENKKIKKYFILGAGANVIFKKDFYDGIIIKIKNKSITWENEEKVSVGAGMIWDDFLENLQEKFSKKENKNFGDEKENAQNIFGIQSLSLIPGTVGASAYGNIGAFGTEAKKYIFGVEFFDIEKKEIIFETFEKLDFSYRNSFFKKNDSKFIILSVTFDFSQKFSKIVKNFYNDNEYFSLEHFAKKHNLGKITKEEIRKNIIEIRKNIYPDIEKFPNVGSTFKNTEISKKQLKNILEKYPEIPNWELENGKIKIPTAYIFDKVLSLNGKQFKNIKINQERPLFFMNMGGATGEEFFNLCQKIKKDVFEKIGVEVEEEVRYVE